MKHSVQTVRIPVHGSKKVLEVKSFQGFVFGVDCDTVRIVFNNSVLADKLPDPPIIMMAKASTKEIDMTVWREYVVVLTDEGLSSNGELCQFDNPYIFDWLVGQRDLAGNLTSGVEITFLKG